MGAGEGQSSRACARVMRVPAATLGRLGAVGGGLAQRREGDADGLHRLDDLVPLARARRQQHAREGLHVLRLHARRRSRIRCRLADSMMTTRRDHHQFWAVRPDHVVDLIEHIVYDGDSSGSTDPIITDA